MSDIDPRADLPLLDWSDLGVSGLLPTGTVTLLLADVEGSTRLWETQPAETTAGFADLDRTARLRDLAHGGQTVLSCTTSDLVCDRLPAGAWLTDLGSHPLRDLPRPERVMQLCHPDLRNEFPPLRVSKAAVA